MSSKLASITFASGGIIETALLPYKLSYLLAHYDIEVRLAVSPAAREFVTITALQGISGKPVYYTNSQFHERSGLPLHLALTESDLMVVYPATARLIAEMALGVITCPVTRVFAFTPKCKIVIAPMIHELMESRIYRPHIETLKSIGCTVLGEGSLRTSWYVTEQAIVKMLGLISKSPSQEVNISSIHRDRSEK